MSLKSYWVRSPLNATAVIVYGENKRDALNAYREFWYPGAKRLPNGVEIQKA